MHIVSIKFPSNSEADASGLLIVKSGFWANDRTSLTRKYCNDVYNICNNAMNMFKCSSTQ